MANVFDVNAPELINRVKDELKNIPEMQPPEWAKFAKTGVSRRMPPQQEDFWFIRAASILRQVYVMGKPMGTQRLRTKYGGRQHDRMKPEVFKKGSGSIIRKILQGLEKSGLIVQKEINGKKGRVMTPKGKSLVDKNAAVIFRAIV